MGKADDDSSQSDQVLALCPEDLHQAMLMLAFMKFHGFKKAHKIFAHDIKERNGKKAIKRKIVDEAVQDLVDAAMARDNQSEIETEDDDDDDDESVASATGEVVSGVETEEEEEVAQEAAQQEEDASEVSEEEEASEGSEEEGEVEGEQADEEGSHDTEKTPEQQTKRSLKKGVSFSSVVSAEEFEAVSPTRKSQIYYSKDEINSFKAEDKAEKSAEKEKKKSEERAERKKREALTEMELKKQAHDQLVLQKRILQERSKEKEEEWRKQQEQAEAMERMMKEQMASIMSFKL